VNADLQFDPKTKRFIGNDAANTVGQDQLRGPRGRIAGSWSILPVS
jgi:hypothetical protein